MPPRDPLTVLTTSYTYDEQSHYVALTKPDGKTTRYDYDDSSR